MAGALDSGALDPGTGDPFGGDLAGDAATGIGVALVVLGLLALAWTVLMVWGSVWALTGRSRVLLLVGGSFAVLVTLIGALGGILDSATADAAGTSDYVVGIVVVLVFFVASLAIVVPLSLRPATQFFAAHRARRGR
jgi:ABC-type Na+ efflux pump permease subunit